jgi:hypothetical protein
MRINLVRRALEQVAFTWCDDEVVRAWDLRRPASHAYTLSTGNLSVRSLAWHEPTTSLLVAANNDHAVSYGRYGALYQYGEQVGHEGDGDDGPTGWPSGAKHDRSFFPAAFDMSSDASMGSASSIVLQYPFESGRDTMALPEQAAAPKRAAEAAGGEPEPKRVTRASAKKASTAHA